MFGLVGLIVDAKTHSHASGRSYLLLQL